ncbi:MAG TPA: sigma-70 family RNA polymerase sigma factor [Candidatus Eisenbacteria bacterium]|jgi:RNA polymerase sigma-70 factor (ECF subfamily)|nr:sigma-70 family RNA polymerase sigma factor [Candidatus Eisenbacteria bacterium]
MKLTALPTLPRDESFIPTRASLLARLKAWDDSRSWSEFFETYWRLIYGRARTAGLSDQEAQEVVQETLIAVSKKMSEFKYDPAVASFKTWLFQIVSCRIADQFRRRKRTQSVEPLPDEDADSLRVADDAALDSATPDAAWDAEWEEMLVTAAAERVRKQVKPEHFQIYDYHVLQGHTVALTANHLQTSSAKVYWVKHRVGAALRQEVERLRERLI